MPFTVEDFQDLVRLLEEKPEWRSALRRLVLSEEYLALPETLANLSRLVNRGFERTDARFDVIEGDVRETRHDVGVLKTDVGVLKTDVGDLKGDSFERRYVERAAAYFGRLALRLRPLSSTELAGLLETALEEGRVGQSEFDDMMACDLVVRGRDRETREELFLVVEISVGVEDTDVERARRQATLVSQATGLPARAVVAGRRIAPATSDGARRQGVWQVIEGQAVIGPA